MVDIVDDIAAEELDKKECRLMTYISDFNRQLDYLYKLITNISVQNLTQVSRSQGHRSALSSFWTAFKISCNRQLILDHLPDNL